MIRLTLPYPPSANRLWRYVGGRPIKSADYRSWLFLTVQEILLQKPKKIEGRFRLSALISAPDRRQRDVDNLAKPVLDSLAAAGVIENDRLAKSVFFEWTDEIVRNGSVSITIEPYPAESLAEAA